jgi:hypothetical protein
MVVLKHCAPPKHAGKSVVTGEARIPHLVRDDRLFG